MIHRRGLPSILLISALASCAAPAPPATPAAPPMDVAAIKDSIQAREKMWSAAFLAADGAAVAALYTEDAASIPTSGDWSRGREAIAKTQVAQFDSTTFTSREDITEEVIPAGPDHLFEVGHYSSAGTAKVGGKPRTSSGRYVVLWRKDADGVWRIHRDLGAEAPAKAPAKP